MTEEQIKEVMRLADEIADYAWKEGLSDGAYSNATQDRECRAESRAELEAYLRTIGEPENTFPLNPNGASKWAHLQKHDGAQAIGVVFRTGTGSVGSLVDGRVVWADWLAYPNGGKSESVNAELLEALKSAKDWLEWYQDAYLESVSECDSEAMQKIDAAITRAESAIETPAKVMHCTFFGLIPEGGMFFDPFSQHEFVKTSATTAVSSTEKDYIEDFHHNEMIVPIEDKGDERPE